MWFLKKKLGWRRNATRDNNNFRAVCAWLWAYESSRKADVGTALAWANMAVPACTRMLYLANCVLSSATSTSLIRLLAAVRLSFNTPNCSLVSVRREMFAPRVARSVASWLMAAFTETRAAAAAVVVETLAPVAPE